MMVTKLLKVDKETLIFQNGKETKANDKKHLCDVLLYFSWGGGMAGLSLAAPQAVAYIYMCISTFSSKKQLGIFQLPVDGMLYSQLPIRG